MTFSKSILIVVVLLFAGDAAYSQDESSWASSDKASFVPEVHHPNVAGVTLFAQNPQIVTPIGIAVAPDGRVFVQENHTHKRNSRYKGPKTDRILIFEDTNDDGVADKRSVFYEGHTFSTDLMFGPDGHLYVSTRWFVGRFRGAATKTKADGEPEKLVVCKTEGDYPHNGVGGLAIDPANPGWLAFGFGENLGADYTFVGSDGTELSGGAEGGSTYRCRIDGSKLTRQSTGHWNAFGMTYDLDGNLFSTDNDPNATPPNRLLHVIPGADFGYEYRYGRSGRHPLVCWHGEHPGTLGKIGALGEAACGVIAHGPGQLLSASWTDNRIDVHSLTSNGATYAATREPFLSGPDDFRPVHFSYSADGKYLYFTDWVKLSYPVHGHGRIWRLEFKQPVQLTPNQRSGKTPQLTPQEALALLGSNDPAVRTQAVHLLSNQPDLLLAHPWQSEPNAMARAHYAVALKRSDAALHSSVIGDLLSDPAEIVRFVGIKWIADESLATYRKELEQLLELESITRQELRAVVAAIARISGDSKNEFSPDETMLRLASDQAKPAELRATALQNVNVNHKRLTVGVLASLAREKDIGLRRQAIRALAIHPDVEKVSVLAELAADSTVEADLRADAIAGMAEQAPEHTKLLEALSHETNSMISREASRTLVSAGLTKRTLNAKPAVEDLLGWQTLIDEAPGKEDIAVGRRLFFHSKLAGCYKCHMMHGRGNQVGPDLTTLRNQSGITRAAVLKHIVDPSAEMAPYYRPQQLLTVDGKVMTGLIVGREGKSQAYVGSNGESFYVNKEDIEERRELSTSIMPNGLLDNMNASEIRDLISYLLFSPSTNSIQ